MTDFAAPLFQPMPALQAVARTFTIATRRDVPESELLTAAIGGDHHAFVDLVERNDDALRRAAAAITGDAIGVDDVLQLAYIKAFRSIRSFKRNAAFTTWMYRIVVNTALDERRKTARVLPFAEPHSTGRTHATDSDVDQRLDIERALSQLPDQQRAVVVLVDGQGFDYRTAAEILGIPPGTVASRINQARTTLRRLLADSYKESP